MTTVAMIVETCSERIRRDVKVALLCSVVQWFSGSVVQFIAGAPIFRG